MREVALRLLEVRARTRSELTRRLEARGFAAAEVGALVERLGEAGLLDDQRFACDRVWVLAGRGQGEGRIEADLVARGVDRDTIARALQEAFEGEPPEARMRALAERRFGPGCLEPEADPRLRARIQRYLVQKGFEPEGVDALFT
jgi:regulatory protein